MRNVYYSTPEHSNTYILERVVCWRIIYLLVILFSWMLRAMLVVISSHYFYWMYLFLLPSPLPSLLLSFSSSFPLFSVSRPVGDVVLKGYFALRWACGSLSSSYQLFYLHEDKSKALLEHGLSWDPRGNIFFSVLTIVFVYDTVYKIPDGMSHVLPE